MRWTDVLLCASFFAWGAFIVPWLAFRWELRAWRKAAEEAPGPRGAVIPAPRPRNLRGPRVLPGAPLGDPGEPGAPRCPGEVVR